MATLTLLEPTNQAGGEFTALNGQTFLLDSPQEIPVKLAMLYMDAHNLKVDFTEVDFTDIADGILENMAIKLSCEISEVTSKLLPKKSTTSKITSKVKQTLTKSAKDESEEIVEESTISDD